MKRIISFFVAIMVIITLIPNIHVKASNCVITVNGKSFSHDNADVLGDGTMQYNASTNTLTIKGIINNKCTINSTGNLTMYFEKISDTQVGFF